MGFIGNQQVQKHYSEYFSGNGVTTSFTMLYPGMNLNGASTVDIRISGINQPASSYGIAHKTLTFSSPPPVGTLNIEVLHLLPVKAQTTDLVSITNLTSLNVFSLNVETSLTVGGAAVLTNVVSANIQGATIQTLQANGILPTTHYASFEDVIAAAAPQGNTILVCSNTICSANTTVPPNVQLQFVGQGMVTINTGVTVTIDSVIEEGAYQIFGGEGNVSFGTSKSRRAIPQWFGTVADGITNDTTHFYRALRSLPTGGVFEIPKGIYLLWRGNGGWLTSSNNLTSNITIQGAGTGTLLRGRNAAGITPESYPGSFYYTLFGAANCANIVIRDLAVEGGTNPIISAIDCQNVLVEHVTMDGRSGNINNYLQYQQVYLERCYRSIIQHCTFTNFMFSVYLSGGLPVASDEHGNRCHHTRVEGCHFEFTVLDNQYTASFPVGVYDRYANNTTVMHNTFKNIYSSVPDGSTGTGMGYGFYEGDGTSHGIQISDNTFLFEGMSDKHAFGIFTSTDDQVQIKDNYFLYNTPLTVSVAVQGGISIGFTPLGSNKAAPWGANVYCQISGNQMINNGSVDTAKGIYILAPVISKRGDFTVSDNQISGNWQGPIEFYGGDQPEYYGPGANGSGRCCVTVQDNFIRGGGEGRQMAIQGPGSEMALFNPVIRGNRLIGGNGAGIVVAYCVGAIIENNTILDGNLGDVGQTTGDGNACLVLTSYAFGTRIVNNILGNTLRNSPKSPQAQGLYRQAVSQASSAVNRIFKDIVFGNQILGFEGTTSNAQMYRQWTTTPIAFLDACPGDIIYNSTRTVSPYTEGWLVANTHFVPLTANASGVTSLTIGSTTGWTAGDNVVVVKANTIWAALIYDTSNTAVYMNVAYWHVDTIASITNSTNFLLTTGLPGGDNTYEANKAYVKRVSYVAI